MSYRFMRLMVMFDLPVDTNRQRKNYRDFRKFLIKNGFMMMQQSIYTKIVPNQTAANTILAHLRKNCPDEGLVQVLQITEKQYSKMACLVGEVNSEFLDSDERLVVL